MMLMWVLIQLQETIITKTLKLLLYNSYYKNK